MTADAMPADLPARIVKAIKADERQGLVRNMPEATYHGGTELSASGAKMLLKSPALYRYQREHGQASRDVWDEGSVVHGLVLGTGWPVRVVDADDWRSNAAREAKEEARAAGEVPILRDAYKRCVVIRDAVHAHPLAGAILADGEPEVSVFWRDELTDVPCRARVDWLHPRAVVDLKRMADCSPKAFQRSAINYGYDLAAAAYIEGVAAVTDPRPYLWVCVEPEPPHLVAVYQPDDDLLALGARKWRDALEQYAACTAADNWPGYSNDIQTLSAPRWAQ